MRFVQLHCISVEYNTAANNCKLELNNDAVVTLHDDRAKLASRLYILIPMHKTHMSGLFCALYIILNILVPHINRILRNKFGGFTTLVLF